MRRIAISDIHGCSATFRALVWEQVKLTKKDELYLLGDYVDRGPNSKGVLDFIFHLKEKGYQVHCLRGNHEQMMLAAYYNPAEFGLWYRNGGNTALQSFDALIDMGRIGQKYWDFIKTLPYYMELEDYFLVHAGFNFDLQDPLQDTESMIWIRRWYRQLKKPRTQKWLGHKTIIHGHTPTPKTDIEMMASILDRHPVLNIDAGCFVFHNLCAYDMTNRKLYFQKNLDMDPDVPWYK